MLIALLACLGVLCGSSYCRTPDGEVRIGRVSKMQPAEVVTETALFMQYLDRWAPGYRFRVVPLPSDAAALDSAVRGDVDFLYVTPSVFVQLQVQTGAMVIATAKRFHGPGTVLKYVGGVVICRTDRRDIARLADLRGKRVMGLNPLALGGWIATRRELADEGIDPQKDFAQLRFGANQDVVAEAVVKGEVDAGVLSISEFPLICNGGKFSAGQFHVLPPRVRYPELDGLPVPATTRLYPGTAFVKMPHVSDDLAEEVAIALFAMAEDDKVTSSLLIAGWTLPANYQPVHECLKQLRLTPYEDFGKVTLWGAVGQHWQMVTLSLIVLLGALTVAMVSALYLNRQLLGSRAALETELEQRRQAERVLSYQAKLIAQTRDAVVATDAGYLVTFWNEAAERLYGYSSSEVLGRRIEEIVPFFVGNETRHDIRRKLEQRGEWSGEVSFKNKSGSVVFADMVLSTIKDSDGRTTGTLGGIRDITERKRLEEQLLQSQKMQAIGLLAGGVAHDFNNLLTVINGYTQLARDEADDGSSSAGYLSEVLTAGKRAAELTQQLLAFGRKQVLQLQVLELNLLVSDTERLLRRLIGEDIELILELDPAAGCIKADAGQIQQVIMNLALNARDALPNGGRLVLRTSSVEIGPRAMTGHAEVVPGRYAVLTVEDNGTGMDEETKRRIFEPFFTTKETGKGTGLGLSTVYGIVKQSGGHIWVQSQRGKGSTFTVSLPTVTAVPASPPQSSEMPSLDGEGSLLVVEDQTEVRELVCRVLQSCGYRVTAAANAEEALRIGGTPGSRIDLLLTDVVMPGMTGPELAVKMKLLRPSLKVLFMSGYSDLDSAQRACLESKATCLQKPFLPAALAARVRDILGEAPKTNPKGL